MLKFWKGLNELYAWLIIIAFGFVMLIGIWQVYDSYYLFHHTLEHTVQQYKPNPANPTACEDSPITDEMVAWITIDNTTIDYPVMQGKDNIRFLNTDPFGGYSLSGSIFLDSRCSSDFSDSFSVIYGHHMERGRMFGALDDFLNTDYLQEHTTGTLLLGKRAEQQYPLEVFAAMRVSAREKIVFDLEQDQIRNYIQSFTGVPVDERRILCLTTCADADLVSRIAVFCYIDDQEL